MKNLTEKLELMNLNSKLHSFFEALLPEYLNDERLDSEFTEKALKKIEAAVSNLEPVL